MRVVSTSAGRIFVQLHAGGVEASFGAGVPQCLYSHGALEAVRMQVGPLS